MGELRSMALGIPGSAGLLSLLQNELTQALRGRRRVHLRPATKSHIRDLLALAGDLAQRPTRIAELFPTHPAHGYGVCDAAKSGFGGSLFPSAALLPSRFYLLNFFCSFPAPFACTLDVRMEGWEEGRKEGREEREEEEEE